MVAKRLNYIGVDLGWQCQNHCFDAALLDMVELQCKLIIDYREQCRLRYQGLVKECTQDAYVVNRPLLQVP